VGERLRRLEEEPPEQVEEAPVGRVQLQSRVDAVLARALRAPPLAAGTIASTRFLRESMRNCPPAPTRVSSWTIRERLRGAHRMLAWDARSSSGPALGGIGETIGETRRTHR
jgi:hypothetical protein